MDATHVVLAGSGRSGTTWLGSLLDSSERVEYFYEICAYHDIDFDHPDLLRIKYPLTHWLSSRPAWMRTAERAAINSRLKLNLGVEGARRSERIHKDYGFRKSSPNVYLFKIVRLLWFALRVQELADRFGQRMKVVHIIRNPFSQLVSEMRIYKRNPDAAKKHYQERIRFIVDHPDLVGYHELALKCLSASWIEQMALVWWVSNELMMNQGSLDCHLVVYENLCSQTLQEIESTFAWLGWTVTEQTRRHIARTTAVGSSESGNFSIRKNQGEVMTRWRQEINASDYDRVVDLLAPCELLEYWSSEQLSLCA